jgi:hypothetical protein
MKKSDSQKLDTKINALSRLVEKGFAAVSHDIAHLPTRSDVGNMIDNGLRPLSAELTSIRNDLEQLTDKVDNISGLPKEIDHALEHITAIEKHLGLDKKIAA